KPRPGLADGVGAHAPHDGADPRPRRLVAGGDRYRRRRAAEAPHAPRRAQPVLAAGPGGLVSVALLFGWTLLTVFLSWVYYTRSLAWSRARIQMTNDLVERMVGHRTRLAQEPPALWHSDEDRSLSQYVD